MHRDLRGPELASHPKPGNPQARPTPSPLPRRARLSPTPAHSNTHSLRTAAQTPPQAWRPRALRPSLEQPLPTQDPTQPGGILTPENQPRTAPLPLLTRKPASISCTPAQGAPGQRIRAPRAHPTHTPPPGPAPRPPAPVSRRRHMPRGQVRPPGSLPSGPAGRAPLTRAEVPEAPPPPPKSPLQSPAKPPTAVASRLALSAARGRGAGSRHRPRRRTQAPPPRRAAPNQGRRAAARHTHFREGKPASHPTFHASLSLAPPLVAPRDAGGPRRKAVPKCTHRPLSHLSGRRATPIAPPRATPTAPQNLAGRSQSSAH
ncbi:basic proline-rich protein-like [Diceros bicornis minor]|uniref:basic proline-rich protein-like n=1 Tax=Diceros bicornis minor TaxID=77932 RepID=UPI0026EC67CA|nr:basic proline-rich protein-like [Diceros bicornis minor]